MLKAWETPGSTDTEIHTFTLILLFSVTVLKDVMSSLELYRRLERLHCDSS